MTNEEVKAELKRRIKDKKEMVERRIEFLEEEARLFAARHVQKAKDDTGKKLDEVYDLPGTIRMQYAIIEACKMQKSAFEAALGLLEN